MKRGFTLIELLVLIAICGLVATLFAIPITEARKRCKDTGDCKVNTQVKDALKNIASEYDECMKLSDLAQKDLPVKCLKYYTK